MADVNQIKLPNGSTYNLSTYKLLSSDTRSDNQLPSWYMSNYPKCTVEEFKSCGAIGVNSIMSGTYCVLHTITPWGDSSGGLPIQVAVSDRGIRAQRVATANNTWGSWIALPNSDTTYESKAAASGGTAVSLCTTGEKYTWNNKSNLTLGTTSTTALKGDTKYAGSSSAGGSATSAVKLDTATAGSATQPCYFTGGKPSACTYSLNKTVPANAVFTDTTYESKTAASGGTDVSLCTTGEKYSWNAKLNSSGAITRDTVMPSTTTYSVDNLHGGTRFVYSTHGTPSAGTIVSFDSGDSNNYGLQLSSSYNAGRMWYRTRNGDTNTWHNWIEVSPRYEYDAIGTASSKIYYIPIEMRGANTAQSSYLLTCPETDGGGGLYFLRPNASTSKMEIYTIVAGHSTVTQTTDTWGFVIRTSGSYSTKPSIIRL